MEHRKIPHPVVSVIPIVLLIAMLVVIINLFGSDALSGGSQIALIMGMAVCVLVSMVFYHVPWKTFEKQMAKTMSGIFVTIMILLCVGMLAGSWMISGVVPTLIYYGIELLSPRYFLVTACVICSLVSLLSGSSWTTIATIGVALLGVGEALGIDKAWTAGAIISGAYFGDKMSPLSDTTILASTNFNDCCSINLCKNTCCIVLRRYRAGICTIGNIKCNDIYLADQTASIVCRCGNRTLILTVNNLNRTIVIFSLSILLFFNRYLSKPGFHNRLAPGNVGADYIIMEALYQAYNSEKTTLHKRTGFSYS